MWYLVAGIVGASLGASLGYLVARVVAVGKLADMQGRIIRLLTGLRILASCMTSDADALRRIAAATLRRDWEGE